MVTMAEATIIRIKDLCEKRHITIMKMAEISNVSQSTINEIMQGRSKHPRIITLKKIANGLGVSLSEFFDHEIFDQISNLDEPASKKREKN
jgi:transcriptional regulator with XRE-family HTH domain